MGRHSRTHIKWQHRATQHTLHCPKTRWCHFRKKSKQIALLELTCCFESIAEAANSRKTISYRDMKTNLEERGYTVFLIPFEIGSRGFINKRNRTTITQILKEFSLKVNPKQLFINMSKIAPLCSFTIFQAQAQPTWQDPPFLKP